MPRDISGNYTLPAGNPVVDGTIINVAWANPTMSDIAVQLNNVLTRDGVLGATSPIKFSSGSAAAPSITFAADPALGFYRAGANTIGIAVSGVAVGSITSAGFVGAGAGLTGLVAANVVFAPTATLAAVNVQTAIDEADTENRALLAAYKVQLADATSSGNGAGLVGLLESLAYAAGTVGAFARRLNPLRKYGVLNNDGVTDDSATFQAAAASGDRFIDARGLNCKVQGQINIPANQTWLLAGTSLTMTGSTLTMWQALNVDNWALIGPFKITGDGSTVGTAAGVLVSGCNNWRVDNYTAYTIKGWGFYLQPGAGANRTNHGNVLNYRADTCYRGWEDVAGTGAEYSTLVAPTCRNCADAGMITSAGNILVVGGHITENLGDGVRCGSGPNSNHGIFLGCNINHNAVFNLWTQQVLNGQSFIGCHFYANDAIGDGSIFLDKSKGINISGGHLDCQIYNYKDGSSGQNVIENMFCPGGYGVCRRGGSNNGHDQLIIRGCYGPGAYSVAGGGVDTTGVTINDPALCYVYAERSIAATQALTSNVAAVMLFPSLPFPDRRGAYSTGTGVFTVPSLPTQAGLYSISFDVLFDGVALSPVSFVACKINGVVRKIFACAPYSTTKLSAGGSFDIYLAAGDTVTFEATITGTTPVFGDSLGTCDLAIKRIA